MIDTPEPCDHGYTDSCPDCDVPDHMPAVLPTVRHDRAGEPSQLYGPAAMARALGVTQSAVSNYLNRHAATGKNAAPGAYAIPAPPFIGPKGTPLWRAVDIQTVIAARIAAIEAYADTLKGE